MTFQNLRNNNTVYIIDKSSGVELKTGKVTNISLPVPRYSNSYSDLIVDLSVDVNGEITNFQKIPANSEIADFKDTIIISCNKYAITDELEAIKQRSKDLINSVDHHRRVIAECETALQKLNPDIAENRKRDMENLALREEVASLKEMISNFINNNQKK